MSGLEIIMLVEQGKCNEVYLSKDSRDNFYILKKYFVNELLQRKKYKNVDGKLIKKTYLDDFINLYNILLLINQDNRLKNRIESRRNMNDLDVQEVNNSENNNCVICYNIYGIYKDDSSTSDAVVYNGYRLENEIEFVYELCEYGSLINLKDFTQKIPHFPKKFIKCVTRDVLISLNYLSSINVAHRDIKPSNIFINKDGRAKLGDFSESEVMVKGKVKGYRGTYYFLSPELLTNYDSEKNNREHDGSAIDIWALGITLFILFFRKFPYSKLKEDDFKSVYNDMVNEIRGNLVKNISNSINEMNEGLRNSNKVEDTNLKDDEKEDLEDEIKDNLLFENLLRRFLEMNPERRIKPSEALNHEWLKDVDYEAAKEFCRRNLKNIIRDKPWDNDSIDHWKIEPFLEEDNPPALVEESSFMVLFPKYREKYIKSVFNDIKKCLSKYYINIELDLLQGSLRVITTDKTFDPYIIIKARDMVKLISRSVPFAVAKKILSDEFHCDVVPIGNIVRNREKFLKRRQRLVGPGGSTLKALELLTDSYILVQGQTVSIIGSIKSIKTLRKIVIDCMNNIHPIYYIKELMIKRELIKDEKLVNENWSRFLPQFKKKCIKRKKSKIVKKKTSTLLLPIQKPRKEDILLETGEYFIREEERKKELKMKRNNSKN